MIVFKYDKAALTLPNPGKETKLVNVKVQYEHAMDGTIFSYANKPASDKYELPFTSVAKSKMEELINFLIAYAGETITYIDKWNVSRNVKILTDPAEFSDLQRSQGIYYYSFSLTVEVIP